MPSRLVPLAAPLLLALAAPLFPPTLSAQSRPAARIDPDTMPRPSLEARRAAGPITLDGTLDEAAWAQADSTRGAFYQSIPDQGASSSERTVVRVLYDDDRLYLGAIMYDSRPELLVSAGMEQDFATQDSDIFGFALDTYLDRQNAFLFAVNPAGALEVAWRDPLWDASVLLKTVGDDFNPGVGFVARRGLRQGFLTLLAHIRSRASRGCANSTPMWTSTSTRIWSGCWRPGKSLPASRCRSWTAAS